MGKSAGETAIREKGQQKNGHHVIALTDKFLQNAGERQEQQKQRKPFLKKLMKQHWVNSNFQDFQQLVYSAKRIAPSSV